jgi:hypothetical protein
VPIILPGLRDAAGRSRCAIGEEKHRFETPLRYSSVRKSIRSTTCGAGIHARLWK